MFLLKKSLESHLYRFIYKIYRENAKIKKDLTN